MRLASAIGRKGVRVLWVSRDPIEITRDYCSKNGISHIIKGRPFGVGFECLAHSLQERNTLYD